ncbi:hypothetical protein WS83_21865 [Burkholderia sp. MSMB2042]|nr:hypothetical protein WS78_15690 [Burkholderia savannae]KVG43955.1 hypothetical protein WS77_10400 [Burkholderia sp. MSMB0265]KVG83855.1 hypothetical protein WS81_07285 [Burkholderia sp. MSMB2040]KVG94888.1 hypothetical protein WS82_05790 [Burkholderia sp. MSMB2041]KVH00605.1 hypothetical protein WS83_21865 [Burkholderia sp. MSMB2042]KVK81085.1 hypothetical protein WS91_11120 [Burkholderia sp. MSMB1498]
MELRRAARGRLTPRATAGERQADDRRTNLARRTPPRDNRCDARSAARRRTPGGSRNRTATKGPDEGPEERPRTTAEKNG